MLALVAACAVCYAQTMPSWLRRVKKRASMAEAGRRALAEEQAERARTAEAEAARLAKENTELRRELKLREHEGAKRAADTLTERLGTFLMWQLPNITPS